MTNKTIDIHQEITDKIIAAIEEGTQEHQFPWVRQTTMPNRVGDNRTYSGINVLILWAAQQERNFTTAQWGTFKAWRDAGGFVRRGEKGQRIVFYKSFERENKEGETETIPVIRHYTVFNRDQVDIESEEMITPLEDHTGHWRDVVTETAHLSGAKIIEQGQQAFYSPGADTITMPLPHYFINNECMSADAGYACILAHELIHWTGHKTRLKRLTDDRTKSDRAFEELVAELGSAFLCGTLGVQYNGVPNHACYIESWLNAMKSDKKAIFKAAALASKANLFITEPLREAFAV